jgi:nicotinamidase-related amidase
MKLDSTRTVAVAIDMHRGHFDPAVATMPLPAERAARVIATAAPCFDALRARRVPIVHVVTMYRTPEEALSNPFWRAKAEDPHATRRTADKHNVLPSRGTEIIPDLYRASDQVVTHKKRYDCFYGTDLEFVLRALHAETVLLAGVNTNSCVLGTAFAANVRDFRTIVVTDCVDSMDGDALHEAGLAVIRTAVGWTCTTAEVLAAME